MCQKPHDIFTAFTFLSHSIPLSDTDQIVFHMWKQLFFLFPLKINENSQMKFEIRNLSDEIPYLSTLKLSPLL